MGLSRLIFVTLLQQLWWVAVWGIVYLAIEFIAKKSKALELQIYILLLLGVWSILYMNPDLIKHT